MEEELDFKCFKKVIKKNPRNGGIILQSSAMKFLTGIVTEITEIINTIPVSEEQQIAEKTVEYNTPAFVCFVDLTKAFDRIYLKHVQSTFV